MAKEKKLSDMMTHYKSVKAKYPDCIVFYRLGDFYEMFFEDAVEASRVLELTLTGRSCGLDERAPMCGVPYHAADSYIATLVEKGYKVAICEQLTESDGKNPVERDVIRVVTSGTLTDERHMDEKKNNFICSVFFDGKIYGVAWADITTGEFFATQKQTEDELTDLLARIDAAETIVYDKIYEKIRDNPLFTHGVLKRPSPYKEYAYSFGIAEKKLLSQFKTHGLEAFGIADKKAAVSAAGALLEYLGETQMHALKNISSIAYEQKADYMMLDLNCMRNLEILKNAHDGKTFGSLLYVLDKTSTAMGGRLIVGVLSKPLQKKERIEYRLDGVDELYKNILVTNALRETLCDFKDVERIAGKISNDVVSPKDMELLKKSLALLTEIKFRLSGLESKVLKDIDARLTDQNEVVSLLKSAIVENAPASAKEGGFIKRGFDEEYDKLVDIGANGKQIISDIEAKERERTGIKNLRVSYNKVFGYYIEVTNSFLDKVPYDYIRKQTLTGAERFITEELKSFEDSVLSAEERRLRREIELFAKLKRYLGEKIDEFKKIAESIAVLDLLCSFAFVAKKNNYVRPEISEKDKLEITGGRHPVVENVAGQFIANDAFLDTQENSMMIITGPNMAGKSTYLRQVALITIMAHCGCFVPAKSAVIPIVDRVFTRIGASDNLLFDQSTFMVEMSEVALILRAATQKSLIILDEVGRGTSTYDGLGIAWSVVEYICKNLKAKTLFATHYHELSELEGVIEGVKNYKITVKESDGSIVFLRHIVRGSANKSFGIEVAALAGVPEEVTRRAKVILKRLEKNDLAKRADVSVLENAQEEERTLSDSERMIVDTDLNEITPSKALQMLFEIKQKIEKENKK